MITTADTLLQNKVAIVTGGNGGIGFGIAEGLLAASCAVIIAGRDRKKNESTLEKVRKTSTECKGFVFDANSESSRENLIDFALKTYGRVDILVNNAGITRRSLEPDLLSDLDWRQVIDTNLNSIHYLTSALVPNMKKAGSGKIINIGSMMSIFGSGYAASYSASKGGVVQYTKSCAVAWAKYNIQVNAILPGWIDTQMTDGLKASAPVRYQEITGRIPANRWGRPEDMAGIAVFLASQMSDYITGAAIPVDGGYSVY